MSPRVRTAVLATAAGTATVAGGSVGVVASDPDTEIVLWPIDKDAPGYVDDEACKACEFEQGAECWCPVPGEPVVEDVVCGCYTPLAPTLFDEPQPEPVAR